MKNLPLEIRKSFMRGVIAGASAVTIPFILSTVGFHIAVVMFSLVALIVIVVQAYVEAKHEK